MAAKKTTAAKGDEKQGETPAITFDSMREIINKTVGSKVVYSPNDDTGMFDVPRWSTGVLSIDVAIGGGAADGKNIYLIGPPSVCKSTLIYSMMAEITNRETNNKVFLEDVENSFDVNWARALGVNMQNVQVGSSAFMEQSIDVLSLVMKSGLFAAVFLDSIAALSPKKVVEGSAEDNTMGIEAKALSRFFKNLERDRMAGYMATGVKTTFVYSNQIRNKIGIMFGSPITEPGGEAAKFYASIRIKLSPPEEILDNDEQVGGRFSFQIVKNKTYPAWKKGSFVLFTDGERYGQISNEEALLNYAEQAGIIVKKGSWYSYGGNNIAQGLVRAAEVLRQMPAEAKNKLLEETISILYPREKLAFRFKDDKVVDDGGLLCETGQDEGCEDQSE